MKRRMILLVLLTALLLSGCGDAAEKDRSFLATAISHIDTKAEGHVEQLHDYDSPYTICYRNKDDTYSMYIFASPIQYKTDAGYEIIDNTVVPTEKEGFVYENKAGEVKTYFPQTLSEPFRVEKGTDYLEFRPNLDTGGFSKAKQMTFQNMYGDQVSAVVYEGNDMDMAFYPTKAGIRTELVLKEKPKENTFAFIVKSSTVSYEDKQNGYVLFKNGGENKSIIYGPLVQYTANGEQQLDVTTQMEVNREEGDTIVSLKIDEDILGSVAADAPVQLDSAFEMYRSKTPDSTVYENHNVNNYLANYAVIGDHPVWGEGWHYSRFSLHKVFDTVKSVIHSTFYVKSLYASSSFEEIGAFAPSTQWQSSQILWGSKAKSGTDIVSSSSDKTNRGYYEFDMTDFTNRCLVDDSWLKEDIGLVFRLTDAAHTCIATSDHSLYPPYMKVDLIELPEEFYPRDDYFN